MSIDGKKKAELCEIVFLSYSEILKYYDLEENPSERLSEIISTLDTFIYHKIASPKLNRKLSKYYRLVSEEKEDRKTAKSKRIQR